MRFSESSCDFCRRYLFDGAQLPLSQQIVKEHIAVNCVVRNSPLAVQPQDVCTGVIANRPVIIGAIPEDLVLETRPRSWMETCEWFGFRCVIRRDRNDRNSELIATVPKR